MSRTPSTSWIRYSQEGDGPHVTNHACPIALEADLIARIAATYGEQPVEVKHLRASLWLDSGGMVMLDMPTHRVRLPGYSVVFKEEHAALYAAHIVGRLEDTARIRTYAGVPCLTLYQRFWHVVLPVTAVQRVLRAMKRVGLEGHTKAKARLMELAGSSPHVHVDLPTPGEA